LFDLNRPLSIHLSGLLLVGAGNNQKAAAGKGFPQAAVDASKAGGLTKANKPTANNSIGLDIE